jgi:hypothetical protein
MKNKRYVFLAALTLFLIILISTGDLFAGNFFTGKSGTGDSFNSLYITLGYVGTSALDLSFNKLELKHPLTRALFTTVALSFVKEFGDEMYMLTGLKEHPFWDRRGGVYEDILRAAFGGGCYVIVKTLTKEKTEKQILKKRLNKELYK